VNGRRIVAWAVVGFYVVAVVTGVLLQAAGGGRSTELVEGLAFMAAFGLFAGLGAILIARRPRHVMGPLFATIGLLPAIGFPGETLAALRVLEGGTTPLWARLLAWPNTFYWYVVLAIIVVYVPLLFPDGHLPSRRWRWIAWPVGFGVVILCAISAVAERIHLQTRGPDGQDLWIDNPFGVAGMPFGEDNPLFDPVGSVIILGVVGAIAAVVVRFRRSHGVERQQFKWFLSPVCLIGVSMTVEVAPLPLPAWVRVLGNGASLLGFVGLPVSITVAILRFRLYEIDRLISRTVTYAVVTATLLVTYTAVATLPGVLIDLRSDLLVAAATLAAAAVFVPVRQRVQRVVDRRFNRARYDAARVVDRFGARLRAELDLDGLADDLRGVVASTVQPAHVSLWLARERGR
jgi:hypothetical protein